MTNKTSLTLTFASGNAHKHQELEKAIQLAGLSITLAKLPKNYIAPEENADGFIENAALKAKAAINFTQADLILAEDAGLEIFSLAGQYGLDPFPGVRSNRWLTPAIRAGLIGVESTNDATYLELNAGLRQLLANQNHTTAEARKGRFISAMVLVNGSGEVVFETTGDCPLEIVGAEESPDGENGFGYDPIVRPVIDGQLLNKTMAQLNDEEKNAISHRGKALKAVFSFLESHN